MSYSCWTDQYPPASEQVLVLHGVAGDPEVASQLRIVVSAHATARTRAFSSLTAQCQQELSVIVAFRNRSKIEVGSSEGEYMQRKILGIFRIVARKEFTAYKLYFVIGLNFRVSKGVV